jgi:hypothetical protein
MLRMLSLDNCLWIAASPCPYRGAPPRPASKPPTPNPHTGITRCNHSMPSGQALSKGLIMSSSLGAATLQRHCTHACTSTSEGSSTTPVPSPCADNTPSTFLTATSSYSCTSSVRSLPPPKTPTKSSKKWAKTTSRL